MTNKTQSDVQNNWHHKYVGGLWNEIGELQFEFLISRGLKPADFFLDVGCGSLRGGVHFIQYLETGHYYGIDKNAKILDAGKDIELPRSGLTQKLPNLYQIENFDFSILDRKFNYAIAQSVFTHISLNDIIMCIMNIEKALAPGGKFFATFFENPDGKFNLAPIRRPNVGEPEFFYTYFNKDIYHYDFHTFELICEDTDLEVEYIGDWKHPRNQKIMVFTKK